MPLLASPKCCSRLSKGVTKGTMTQERMISTMITRHTMATLFFIKRPMASFQ